MQLIEAKMGDYTGVKDRLSEMKVSLDVAMEVNDEDAPTVRNTISRLHSETAMKFKTKKADTGILVWRTA